MAAMSAMLNVQFVGYAKSEPEAREWLACNEGRWNLAVVDLFIEEGTGFGVLGQITPSPDCEHVVMLTNSATPENRKRAVHCGADAVFDKTAELEEFFEYCEALTVV